MADQYEDLLGDGEELHARVPIAGFHASKSEVSGATDILLTSDRYVVLRQRGAFKKRVEVARAWPHRAFTERINSNEGTALGPFLYFVSLFTQNDETVSAAFRTGHQRDEFKHTVAHVIAAANGW